MMSRLKLIRNSPQFPTRWLELSQTHCSWFLKKSALSSWKTSRGGFLVGFYCSILNRLEGILWDQSRMRIQMQLQKIFCPFVKYLFMWSTWKICTCWRWNWIGVKWMRVGYFSSLFVKYSYEIKVYKTTRLTLLTLSVLSKGVMI